MSKEETACSEYRASSQLDMNWTGDKYWSERVATSKAEIKEAKKAYIKGYGNRGGGDK